MNDQNINEPDDESGPAEDEQESECRECGGEGRFEQTYGGPHGDLFSRIVPCTACQGDREDPPELQLPDWDDTGLPESRR